MTPSVQPDSALQTPPPSKTPRPPAITVVGLMIFFVALLNIGIASLLVLSGQVAFNLAASDMIAPLESEQLLTEEGDLLATVIILVIFSIVLLIIGIGFLRLERWAWVAAMTWLAFSLLFELATLYTSEATAISSGFAIVLIFMINSADVRRAFGIVRRQHEATPLTPLESIDRH
ncbi:MAG TPA: hypothetical protein VFD70_18455 [Anaerolineae bacterium]|nr:hypothetical protein [Anaerolineae bacterium]